ncbi:DUF167 domain-containing protein [Hymenobacter endophyticus]|uniref:UPF0235 protein ROI90_08690 n=1 Tax=Hymenobacter endophyticus TaxID=3076335 RepID=A0ABU3TGG3_9BACT|nr:DUF167 domain-containing protein [Hymenobacter endophyticus]MDU0370465.1 DUF167 domain-containing protein [Hymenobacter endophyticus]
MAILHLKARPNSRRTQLEHTSDGSWLVRLQAPAQDGKANACLLAYLAEVFAVSKSSITLLSGHTAPFKKVELVGVTEQELQALLQQHRAG